MNELAHSFRFQSVDAGKEVFKYGDSGEYFYIIFKGFVGVEIPN
jgi:CRP-like cAMP-binding protein